MVKILLFALLCTVSIVYGSLEQASLNIVEFNVPLDHFRPQDNRSATFQFEFDAEFYHLGGPLFFYINDAGDYTTEWITRGLIYDLARELDGALFTTDLRFFRQNLPTESASLNDLSFLTVEQGISDVVAFVRSALNHIQAPADTKIYLWGAGLGGTLAVLARQKFPFLITAAWSSGGIFEPTVFSHDNYNILAENLIEFGSQACYDRTQSAFAEIERQLVSGDSSELVEEFRICQPWNITNEMDVGLFSEGLLNQIIRYIDRFHFNGVESFCNGMAVYPEDSLRSLGRWVRYYYNPENNDCYNYNWNELKELLTETTWQNPGTISGLRQFNYLQCTQIGQMKVADPNGIFGNRITEQYRHQMCNEALGSEYDFEGLYLAVEDLRILYGGRYPAISHVIFSNGMIDTWFNQGITYYYHAESHVINIPAHGRRADLGSLSTMDSIALYNAKLDILNIFRDWQRS